MQQPSIGRLHASISIFAADAPGRLPYHPGLLLKPTPAFMLDGFPPAGRVQRLPQSHHSVPFAIAMPGLLKSCSY
jgi:hypothetical protein